MYDNISAQEFKEGIENNPNAVVLDVRTPGEFNEGMIPNAININIFDPGFMGDIQNLDKSKEYFVYCRSGNRSGSACSAMSNLGFKTHNLAGGIGVWNGEIAVSR